MIGRGSKRWFGQMGRVLAQEMGKSKKAGIGGVKNQHTNFAEFRGARRTENQ